MKRFTWFLVAAIVYLGAAAVERVPAQTVVGPQNCNIPTFVNGADSTGTLTCRQPNYTDLAFPALFGLIATSSIQATVALGDQTFYLDSDPGFQQGYTVQIISTVDPQAWMAGRISTLSTAGGQTQITVSVTQDQGDSFTGVGWYLQVISSDAAFIPVTGVSLSSLTYGTGAGQISQGGVVNLTTESGLLLNNSHVVAVAIGSPTNYFRGISQYNSSTGALTIYTTDSSGSGTFTAWSLFAQDGPPINANQIAVSQSNNTIASGVLAFIIQAGQNLPLQGPVTITALSATSNQMLGTIQAYSGTTLSVQVPSTGLYGSGNFGSWSILNTGPPQTSISLYQMNGLQGVANGKTITIGKGSVRDSSNTINLSLSSSASIDLTSSSLVTKASGAGTISSAGAAVTGVSSAFLSFFSAVATLTDFTDQVNTLSAGFATAYNSIISTASQSAATTVVTNDTSLTTDVNLGAGGGTSYFRGGVINTNNTSDLHYGIGIGFNNSTGDTVIFATSFTFTGAPDLPVNVTYYRIIAHVKIHFVGAGVYTSIINQPLGSAINIGVNTDTQIFNGGASGAALKLLVDTTTGTQGNVFSEVDPGNGLTLGSSKLDVNLSVALSQLTADVNLNNVANYFDGPQMAQGNAGTWSVTGGVTVLDTSAAATIDCKLWDGTGGVYDSGRGTTGAANFGLKITLAGILSNMVGNIRISCKDSSSTSGKIKFNSTGNQKDSTIQGIRIN